MAMPDEEIIKALECCLTNKCDECSIYKKCHSTEKGRVEVVLDLIKRKDAEIERLKKILENRGEICKLCEGKYTEKIKRAKAKAIKEFAERFEKEIETSPYMSVPLKYTMLKNARQIKDNLVKEMVGD